MEKDFSISDAAKMAGMTSETLRHYDRIGLVKPSRKDEWTSYRYYTRQDIVRLNTVHALAQMDLSLREIKEVLDYDDLSKIVDFLKDAERRADEKIKELERGKEKIRLARANYERKLGRPRNQQAAYTQALPQRTILLSDELETPTLENLWNYHRHFFGQLPPETREEFSFEDLAGIYTEADTSRMFAQCQRHGEDSRLKTLPAGTWLCADCTETDRERTLENLLKTAREQYGAEPEFAVQLIVISGILQWNYQVQVLVEKVKLSY